MLRALAHLSRGFTVAAVALAATGAVVAPRVAHAATPRAGSAVAVVLDGSTLRITGTNAADSVVVTTGADAATMLVDVDNGAIDQTFPAAEVTDLSVALLGGNDTFHETAGAFTGTPLNVDGGTGNDTIIGGSAPDVLSGGPGNDVIDGGQGNDTLLLGPGRDTATWAPGDGSDVVEGDAGADTLAFNGSNIGETIDVSANGSRVHFTRDVAAVTQDLNGVETLHIATLGSPDTVTVDPLAGTDVKHVDIDLGSQGGGTDGAADSVVVNGTAGPDHVKVTAKGSAVVVGGLVPATTIAHSDPGLDRLQVNGLDGTDTVNVAGPAFSLLGVGVDLGPQ